MSQQETAKHLERARKHLEKNKLQDAVAAYQAVLQESPNHPEAVQMLSDIYVRLGDLVQAARYFGLQFDRLAESGDTARASAIFTRYLKAYPQPPARLARYAFLLQKQNKTADAMEYYSRAAQQYRAQRDAKGEYECLQRVAQLDPENSARQEQLAKTAEELGNPEAAARAYLRAAQLAQAGGNASGALQHFANAHRLAPNDRSIGLLFADARLHNGEAAAAFELLKPFAPPDPSDVAFLGVYGEALVQTGQLDLARDTLFAVCRQKPEGFDRLFDLASKYLAAGNEAGAVSVLEKAKEWMFAARLETSFASQLDSLVEAHPKSVALIQLWAHLYEQLNREVKYFDALVRLFDLELERGNVSEACDALDRLVEIDPYDYRIHERISKLEGKASASFLRNINVRAAKVSGKSGDSALGSAALGEGARAPATEEEKSQRAIDDLIVQAEIFLQYSLQNKAVERLEQIAKAFPGHEEKNERLRMLYERANWWPKGGAQPQKTVSAPPVAAPAVVSAASATETHRDLSQIAEITRLMYREVTPKEVLSTAVREIGKYLSARRCVAQIGEPGEKSQLSAEYAAPGVKAATLASLAKAGAQLSKCAPDALGGLTARSEQISELKSLDLQIVLGVPLTDKDTEKTAGILFVGDDASRAWKPNESYFLQAIGDQIMISVNHTRLRSLVRTLAVADEKTGLLGRGAYIDCLLAESKRSRAQGNPLALVILELDRGADLLREEGDGALESYMNQIARAVEPSIRQGDLGVKYTAWSLAFVLPDTTRENAEAFAEKLRQLASQVQPDWAKKPLTLAAVVADASAQASDDNEDRVTEWMNRAEFGLEEIRRHGGNRVLLRAAPQPVS